MSQGAAFVDRRQVRRGFGRAATHYDQADFLIREIDGRMQERLDFVRIDPELILDLGCSRGGSLPGLQKRYPKAHYVGLDAVPEMLAPAVSAGGRWPKWMKALRGGSSSHWLAADAASLPVKAGAVGLVWSNLLMHWLEHPLPMLAEAHRALQVGGLMMFSTLGPDTLKELRMSFGDGSARTQRFTDMHDLGDMLLEAGFADPVVDMEVLTLTYDRLDDMVRELRAAGGTCAMHGRHGGLGGRQAWAAMAAAYEQLRRDGKLPATFEVIYGHAWKAAPKQTADGRSIIRFDRSGRP